MQAVKDFTHALIDDPLGVVAAIWDGITQPIEDDWNNNNYGEAVGRGFASVAEVVAGTKGFNKIRQARTAGDSPSVNADGTPASSAIAARDLANDLRVRSARSPFNPDGTLKSEAVVAADRIIDGSDLGNVRVIDELTSDGSRIEDWGKYRTERFDTPYGRGEMHFYYNPVTGKVNYNIDYKYTNFGR